MPQFWALSKFFQADRPYVAFGESANRPTIRLTVGAMVVGFLAAVIPAVAIAAATNKSIFDGNHHVADPYILRAAEEPSFTFPILALSCSVYSATVIPGRFLAKWVWVFPATILLWNVFTWQNGGSRPYWADVEQHFGSDCGSSEYAYELFVTAPFYTSLTYTLGWAIRRMLLPAKI